MSSETITTALFLITAVIAAGVLINAVYPVIYEMAGTFSSTTHESDTRMRTDFKVIASAGQAGSAQIWMKNIGSQPIAANDFIRSDVFCGVVGDFDRLPYSTTVGPESWTEEFVGTNYDINDNEIWDTGETVKIIATTNTITSGSRAYFQFSLPNGVWRANEFTVS